MKIAILCNRENSYIKLMAEGLQRMLAEIRVEGEVLYDGLAALEQLPQPFSQYIRQPSNGSMRRSLWASGGRPFKNSFKIPRVFSRKIHFSPARSSGEGRRLKIFNRFRENGLTL